IPATYVLIKAFRRAYKLSAPEDPPHVAIDQELAGGLIAMVDDVAASLERPSADQIWITPEANAAAMAPRESRLGKRRRTMTLGYPLVVALSAEQLRAVAAHELSHYSTNDVVLSQWTARLRVRWARLAAELARERRTLLGPHKAFLGWYRPRFELVATALLRR